MLEDFAPTIPDWANDQHTLAGQGMGRGLDHFRKEGAKLIPPPTEPRLPIEERPTGSGRSSSRASKIATPSIFRSFRGLCFDCSRHLIREY